MPSADEQARAALWRTQRDRRIQKRRELEAAMAGDPAAAAAAQSDFQALINFAFQQQMWPTEDDIESPVIKNQDLNL